DLPAQPDLQPLAARLAEIDQRVAAIQLPEPELGPIHSGLARLEMSLSELGEGLNLARKADADHLTTRLSNVSAAISTIRMPDLDPLRERLSAVETAMGSIDIPDPDLSPITARLAELEMAVEHRLHAVSNAVSTQRGPDLSPIELRLAQLEQTISANAPQDPDLAPVYGALARLESVVNGVRADVHAASSNDHLERRLVALQEAVYAIPAPDLSSVVSSVKSIDRRMDLGAVENRLTAIEYGLAAVHQMLRARASETSTFSQTETRYTAPPPPPPPLAHPVGWANDYDTRFSSASPKPGVAPAAAQQIVAPPPPPPPPPPPEPPVDPLAEVRRPGDKSNLLVGAAFGDPDDLEQISGVGPMLGELLQNIGVYYFWQIAEWSPDDVTWVDGKLQHFKGRIDRDNWIGQAQSLASLPQSASRPG
ncbi:MAG: hypothetical protein AAFQ67_04090, partial [Pseudomonadota bacterium]